ncbi:MAG: ubiquinone/menaquinone biosynthesis methyltransferase [Chloroflexi bacterium]|nr:ubiquinone/menaquinone biosynthesis methyltransferase [Chloroflexota bacterium]
MKRISAVKAGRKSESEMSGAMRKAVFAKPLQEIFSAIPRRYELINLVLTWGGVNHWRQEATRECLAGVPSTVLDLGCGTGELTVNLMRRATYAVKVTGLDCSQPMLDLAMEKAAPLVRKPSFIKGYADALPFPDRYFDCVMVSFAFRNLLCENPLAQANLAEIFRVTAPGGKFVVLETGQPENRLLKALFHLYLRWWVLPVGWLISGDLDAYRYLAESAACFYPPEEIKQMLTRSGFSRVSSRQFLFGAIALYAASR